MVSAKSISTSWPDNSHILVEVDGADDRPGAHSNKSIVIGQRAPYIPFPSHSFLSYLGPNVYILLLDCRYVTSAMKTVFILMM